MRACVCSIPAIEPGPNKLLSGHLLLVVVAQLEIIIVLVGIGRICLIANKIDEVGTNIYLKGQRK